MLQADGKEDTRALFESLDVECKGCLDSLVVDFVKYVAINRRLTWLSEDRRQRLAVAEARESFIEHFY